MDFRLLGLRTAFIVLATVDAVALSAQQAPGYSYDVVTRIRMGPTQFTPATDTTPSVAHVVTTAKAWRMDQIGARGPANPSMGGDYIVFDGKVVRSVSNATKTITVVGGPEVLSAAGQMMKAMPTQMTLTNVSVTADSLGPGETMLGMPTSHWRTNSSVTFNFAGMGEGAMVQNYVGDSWIGPPLVGALDPRSVEVGLDTLKDLGMFAEFTKKQLQVARRIPKGLVLKSVISIDMTAAGGAQAFSAKSEVEMVIQNFQRTQVDAHVFEVPADYKVVNAADQMRGALDSARARLDTKKPPE